MQVAHAPGMPGTFSPPPRVNDLDIHHGTYVRHAEIANYWFPLKSVAGKMFPAFIAHTQPAILRNWQKAHGSVNTGKRVVFYVLTFLY